MEETIHTVSTEAFALQAEDPDHTILDVRPIAAYNGWPLQDESRSGHVPGAKSLPLQWTQYMDWVEVLDEKGLSQNAPVTVYGYTADAAAEMADKLSRLGFEAVGVYDGFLEDWAPDPDRPLQRMERYQQLVYPEWVQRLRTGETPPGMRGDDHVLCHAHFGYRQDYEDGHIPGAINVPMTELPSRIDEIEWGDDVVVACPIGQSSIQAARLIGSYEDVEDAENVRSMSGGYQAWDYDLESESETTPAEE